MASRSLAGADSVDRSGTSQAQQPSNQASPEAGFPWRAAIRPRRDAKHPARRAQSLYCIIGVAKRRKTSASKRRNKAIAPTP
jgi:hypothetical protein